MKPYFRPAATGLAAAALALTTATAPAVAAPSTTSKHDGQPPGIIQPIRQGQGQPGQWADCGPVSVVMMLLAMGVTPDAWDPADQTKAIIDIQRADHMNLPSIESMKGTTAEQLTDGLESYGLKTSTVKSTSAVLAAARHGHPSIVNGMTLFFDWPQNAKIPVGHWVVVAGYDPATDEYLLIDPIAKPEANHVHRVTDTQIRDFMQARGRILAVIAR